MPKVTIPEKGDGWVNMHDFQREVRNVGINFKNMGYEWFNLFLKDTGIFYIWQDFSGERTVRYVIEKVKPQHSDQRKVQRTSVYVDESEEVIKVKRRLRLENNQFIGQFAPQKNEDGT